MKLRITLVTVATACVLNTVPAVSQNAAFCLRGCDFGYSECSFGTLQHCQANASGLTCLMRIQSLLPRQRMTVIKP